MKHLEPQPHQPRGVKREKPLPAGDEEDRQNLTQENGPENTGPVDPPMTTSIMQQS